MPSSVSWLIRGTSPTVETVTPRARHAEAARRGVGQPAYGADHGLVVGQRLAHAHEDHVGDATRAAGDLAAGQRPGAGDAPARRSRRWTCCAAGRPGRWRRTGRPCRSRPGWRRTSWPGRGSASAPTPRARRRRASTGSCGWCPGRPPCVRSGVISVGSSAATSSSRWAAGRSVISAGSSTSRREVVGRELLGAEAGQAQLLEQGLALVAPSRSARWRGGFLGRAARRRRAAAAWHRLGCVGVLGGGRGGIGCVRHQTRSSHSGA